MNDEPSDNNALARMRAAGDARVTDALTETEIELRDALDLVEQCAATAARHELQAIAERLGRSYSRAMARLAYREREAVRASVDRS